jgi:hypothetical protein
LRSRSGHGDASGRRSGGEGAVDYASELRELQSSRVESCRLDREDCRYRRRSRIALRLQLGFGLRHTEGERRDDRLRRDEADLVQRQLDGGREWEEQERDDGDGEPDGQPEQVPRQGPPSRSVVVGRIGHAPRAHGGQSPESPAYALMMSRTRRWRTTSASVK